ncbi:hypothetical protein ASD65_14850 [Microbacterium sp. Root61]|uniref:DUF2255 family protein n=1 Tax=Microbacterium sp. Root61 TaxID=1736570 RepID=UPI0006FD38C2|nr:DUF2255 family protein [Microbacterium sp. Root61]KRA25551.1 hypothetical protein ASD65_14850 [Microbacterium sp. Root61]
MTEWTPQDLDRIGRAEELEIASRRPDGTLRPFITIWVVRVGDDVYVRSAHGGTNPWFRRAIASGEGRISAGGIERDVAFEVIDAQDAATHAALDAAYHAKYDRYGAPVVDPVTDALSATATIRLLPQD